MRSLIIFFLLSIVSIQASIEVYYSENNHVRAEYICKIGQTNKEATFTFEIDQGKQEDGSDAYQIFSFQKSRSSDIYMAKQTATGEGEVRQIDLGFDVVINFTAGVIFAEYPTLSVILNEKEIVLTECKLNEKTLVVRK